jgi:hypothetical protein
MMLAKTEKKHDTTTHDASRTLMLITHAHVFTFVEGWNELQAETEMFSFNDHAFNFDYLLHLSGINYLVHPADVPQIIQMIRQGISDTVEFNFRFISRTGEVKTLLGQARLVAKV